MPIPLAQLTTWSNRGAISTSSDAYARIQKALTANSVSAQVKNAEIFLQGSYGNATNIYGDSDVDVVVLYKPTFGYDLTALPVAQQQAHAATYRDADYLWEHLHADVVKAMKAHFGEAAVTPGKRAIKVKTGVGRMEADVVPAIQYRKYASFASSNDMSAHWGIQLQDSSGNRIVNYPKYHQERGEAKNAADRTGGQYKATVRIFKNFRNYLIEKGLLGDKVAPSYFIECLLHNVPDALFIGSFTDTVPAILNHLRTTPASSHLCQNGVTKLVGSEHTEWPHANLTTFLQAAVDKWNNW
jgi:hypothetical protein